MRLIRVAELDTHVTEYNGTKQARAQIAVVEPRERACPTAIWRSANDLGMMAMVVGPRERGASRGNRFLVNKHEGAFPPRKHAACLSARTTGTGKSFVVSPREVHLDKAADLRPPRAKLPPRGGGGRPVMLSAKISTRKMSAFNTFSRLRHLTTKWWTLVFLLSRPHL